MVYGNIVRRNTVTQGGVSTSAAPQSVHCLATLDRFSTSRPFSASRAPNRANSTLVPAPMPELAPVIKATFPFRLDICDRRSLCLNVDPEKLTVSTFKHKLRLSHDCQLDSHDSDNRRLISKRADIMNALNRDVNTVVYLGRLVRCHNVRKVSLRFLTPDSENPFKTQSACRPTLMTRRCHHNAPRVVL